MTDFLTSLTARSFGTETAIRPRLASLFEPVRIGDAALPEVPVAEPSGMAVTREVEVESEGTRKRSGPVPATRGEEVNNRLHSADERSASTPVPRPQPDSGRRRDADLDAESTEKEDTVVRAKVRPRRTQLLQEENENESLPAMRPDSGDLAPKRVSAPTLSASPALDESFEQDHRGLVLPPKVSTELTAQMQNAALAMKVGRGASVREKVDAASPAPAAEPEPSIHVTIGRIEVRAISETKQANRPRPASPVMSLEEYLHRRAQRGGQ